jgi:hypothetical protein
LRRAGHAPPESKAGFYPDPDPAHSGRLLIASSSLGDGKTSVRADVFCFDAKHEIAICCFHESFFDVLTLVQVAQRLQEIRQHPHKESIMKLQFGKNQLVLELSKSPFAWFYGHTERMSLTSLSLMFVQFSLFARQTAG